MCELGECRDALVNGDQSVSRPRVPQEARVQKRGRCDASYRCSYRSTERRRVRALILCVGRWVLAVL